MNMQKENPAAASHPRNEENKFTMDAAMEETKLAEAQSK